MREVVGDLWSYVQTHAIAVPTNIGWTKDGRNVMGRGVAKQAAERYPGLASWYGAYCRERSVEAGVVSWSPVSDVAEIVLFPTKPLAADPALSWRGSASLWLVEHSAWQLYRLCASGGIHRSVALPLVGCGNGNLAEEDVLPLLRKILDDDRFLLVRQGKGSSS